MSFGSRFDILNLIVNILSPGKDQKLTQTVVELQPSESSGAANVFLDESGEAEGWSEIPIQTLEVYLAAEARHCRRQPRQLKIAAVRPCLPQQGDRSCEGSCSAPSEGFFHCAKFDWLCISRWRSGCDPPMGRASRSEVSASPIKPRIGTAKRAIVRLSGWSRHRRRAMPVMRAADAPSLCLPSHDCLCRQRTADQRHPAGRLDLSP